MAAIVPAPVTLQTRVSLSFTCRDLPDLDIMSKTDACVQVWITRKGVETKVGQTEKVKDNLHPRFATPVVVDYFFEELQSVRIMVGDVDNNGVDMIGSLHCTLGDIIGARGQQLTTQLKMAKPNYRQSVITIRAEEVQGANANVILDFAGSHLDKKDVGLFAKSDPYYNILKVNPDGTNTLVFKSDHIKQTLDPVWKTCSLPISHLCGGDLKRPLIIEVWDWDKNSSHDLIGVINTTLEQLLVAKHLDIVNPKKTTKKNYKNSGILIINKVAIIPEYSFLDYLAGGVQLNLAVAIDYTGSNGDPSLTHSLHYRAPGVMNSYAQVLSTVGSILLPYDYDGWVPAYGFGGNVAGIGTSHCFSINGDPNKPEVMGVPGLLAAYDGSFSFVGLSGPTNFAPVITQVSKQAAALHTMQEDCQAYMLLCIITDGEITDMPATLEAIVAASELPLSIVIVGVGNADFSKMNRLDSDEGTLKAPSGRKACRDIVQFVPFNRVGGDPMRLAAETLAELPHQFVQYMKFKNIKPRPRVVVQEVVHVLPNQVPVVPAPMQ